MNLGRFLIGRGSGMAALPLLEQAVNLAPADARCQAALSRASADTGHVAEAVAPLEKAVSLDEADPRLHFQLGQLYRRVGNQQAAAAQLKRN